MCEVFVCVCMCVKCLCEGCVVWKSLRMCLMECALVNVFPYQDHRDFQATKEALAIVQKVDCTFLS